MQKRRGTQMINAMCTVSFRGTLMDHRGVWKSVCLIARKDGTWLTQEYKLTGSPSTSEPGGTLVSAGRLLRVCAGWCYSAGPPASPDAGLLLPPPLPAAAAAAGPKCIHSPSLTVLCSSQQCRGISSCLPNWVPGFPFTSALCYRASRSSCHSSACRRRQPLASGLDWWSCGYWIAFVWVCWHLCVRDVERSVCMSVCVWKKTRLLIIGAHLLSLSLSYSGSFALHSRSVYKNGKESPA